jgi:UDP:flavonoid glycosyltransferase YjiC (YdhE family)
MVPLAWAARAAGHDVRMASHPGLAATIVRAGLPAVPIGDDVDALSLVHKFAPRGSDTSVTALRNKGAQALGMYVEIAESMIDGLLRLTDMWRPDAIVYEPTTYAAPIVAAKLGVPGIRHLWAADFTYRAQPLEPEVFGPLYQRYGVREVNTLGRLTVDPCPPSMQIVADYPRQHCRYVPYNGPGTLPSWLLDEPSKPRVCITWGLTNTYLFDKEPKTRTVVKVLAERDVEIVLAVARSDAVTERWLPPAVRVVESLPLHLVMPSCSLIVHQGGPGTLLTAATAGIPQLLLPDLPDRQLNAIQLSNVLGGVYLSQDDDNADRIEVELRGLLEDSTYSDHAQAIRAENERQPSLAATVDAIERIA